MHLVYILAQSAEIWKQTMEGANYYRLNKEFDLVTSNCLVWRIGETATVKNEKEKRI